MITQHVLPVQPTTPDAGDDAAATHHLCAGVHLDVGFRNQVLRWICVDSYHRVAPSYHFDIVPVMRHAWWALHLEGLLHLTIVTSAALPAVVAGPRVLLIAACGFVLAWQAKQGIRGLWRIAELKMAPSTAKGGRSRRRGLASLRDECEVADIRQRLRRLGAAMVVVAVTAAVLIGGSETAMRTSLGVLAAHVLAALLVGGARQYLLNRLHATGCPRPARMSRREAAVDVQQRHPCVIYRGRPVKDGEEDDSARFTLFGDESPFIGSGELIHQWNPPMAIRLLRPGIGFDDEDQGPRDYENPPFKASELVAHLKCALQRLAEDAESVRLKGRWRDRVYVSDTDMSIDRSLLREKITDERMAEIIDNPDGRRHHFLEVSAPVAGPELVATVLLRAGVNGRTLTLDFAGCALTRTPQPFQRIDGYAEHGKRAVVSSALRQLVRLPDEYLRLWRLILWPLFALAAIWARKDRTLTPVRGVLIGTRFSAREEETQEWGEAQLDKTEILKHMKVIERCLLRATKDFLKERNVDVSEFEDRELKIINSGILNMGGKNDIKNSAVGLNANVGNAAEGPPREAGQGGEGEGA
jgi:hypothetical protein